MSGKRNNKIKKSEKKLYFKRNGAILVMVKQKNKSGVWVKVIPNEPGFRQF